MSRDPILLPFMEPKLLRVSLKEAFTRGVTPLPHIITDLQLADVSTKVLTRHQH